MLFTSPGAYSCLCIIFEGVSGLFVLDGVAVVVAVGVLIWKVQCLLAVGVGVGWGDTAP